MCLCNIEANNSGADERFDVVQFFADECYEYVRRRLPLKESVEAAKRLTESVGGRIGTTRRVIITDSGDMTVFEWRFGEGVTFPTPEQRAAHSAAAEV